jgi:hypothetical protein
MERQRLQDVAGEGADVGHADVPATDQRVLLTGGLPGVHAVGPAGDVHRALHQGLVERDQGVTEAPDAPLVAQREPQPLTQRDRGVLDRVVGVDPRVALASTRRSTRLCRLKAVSMWS